MPRITIRRAVSRDAVTISRLAGQLGYPVSTRDAEERLAALASSEDHAVLVADMPPDEVVGWIHVFAAHQLLEPRAAEIGGLIVDEARRSCGIGRLLVEAAEAWASERGFFHVRVRSNMLRVRAHSFYRSLGYRCTKTQGHFIKEVAGRKSGPEGT